MNLKALPCLSIFFFFCFSGIQAQTDQVYASYWSGSTEMFVSLDLMTQTVVDIDSLPGVQTLSIGESTFDPINRRYFNITNLGITIVDAQNGNVLNTFPGTGNIKGLEFDPTTGGLYGSYWSGTHEIFTMIDVSTGAITDIDTLTGVNGLVAGESTLDASNGRYFRNTNLGLIVVDVNNGIILNSFSSVSNLKGLEYDRVSGWLYGSYWAGNEEMFAYVDVASGVLYDVDTLKNVNATALGESTFDPDNGRYFTISNLGVTVIDIQTGSIIDSFATASFVKFMEYPYAYCTGTGTPDLVTVSNASICVGDSAMLSISAGYANYMWSNGATTPSIMVGDSTSYWVSYVDSAGCIDTTASVSVKVVDCAQFQDSAGFVIDTCALDTIPIVQAYVTNVTVSMDTVFLDWIFITGTNDTITSAAVYILNENGVYSISITVNCNGKKASSFSFYDLIVIDHIMPLSIEGQPLNSTFNLFPNPIKDVSTLKFDQPIRNLDITLFTSQGMVLFTQTYDVAEKIPLDFSRYATGVYFLKIKYGNETEMIKVIKY